MSQCEIVREVLFDQVWSKPMTKLSEEIGISDVGLAKICRKMEIPSPPRGYWQKLKAGKRNQPQPKLKPLSPAGVSKVIVRITPEEQRNSRLVEHPESIPVPGYLEDPHRLTQKTLTALTKGKADERGVILPRHKICLDMQISKSSIERACLIMDTLVKALENRDYKIVVSKDRKTIVMVEDESIEIGMDEKIERHDHVPNKDEIRRYGHRDWLIPKYDYQPTSKLILRIRNPAHGARQQWSDGKRQKLEDCLGKFLAGLKFMAVRKKEIREERAQWQREWEEEQRRLQEMRRLALIEKKKTEKLTQDASNWMLACQIRSYLHELEKMQSDVNGLSDWIAWARDYVNQLDPLVQPDTLVFKEEENRSYAEYI